MPEEMMKNAEEQSTEAKKNGGKRILDDSDLQVNVLYEDFSEFTMPTNL
jgi:hypothetical protein